MLCFCLFCFPRLFVYASTLFPWELPAFHKATSRPTLPLTLPLTQTANHLCSYEPTSFKFYTTHVALCISVSHHLTLLHTPAPHTSPFTPSTTNQPPNTKHQPPQQCEHCRWYIWQPADWSGAGGKRQLQQRFCALCRTQHQRSSFVCGGYQRCARGAVRVRGEGEVKHRGQGAEGRPHNWLWG